MKIKKKTRGNHGDALRAWAYRYYRESEQYNRRSSNKWSPDWLSNFAPYVNDVTSWAPPKTRVLDVGCGGGQTSYLIGLAGFDVVGVDLSAQAIQAGHAKFAKVSFSFATADATRLPFSSGSFGVVGLHATLEHLVDAREALAEGYRVLNPGGVMVVHGPNMISPVRWGGQFVRGLARRRMHPDASLPFLVKIGLLNLKKIVGIGEGFVYRAPLVNDLEFQGSDYDAICLASTFDLRDFAKERRMKIVSLGGGTSHVGRAIARCAPLFAGGIRFIAIKGVSL